MLPRLLYLTHRLPFPPDKGDRIRNFHLLRQLARHFRVSLGCLADEPVGELERTTLRGLCEQVAIVPVSKYGRLRRAGLSFLAGRSLSEGAFGSSGELARTVAGWHAESPFAAAVASATSLIPYLRRAPLSGVPAFVDVVDVDSRKWLDFAESARFPKSLLYRWEGARVRKLEAALPSWATGPFVASQMASASTTLSRLRTVRTPLRNSVELICAVWK